MRTRGFAIVFGAIMAPTLAAAQQVTFQDALLDHLTGKWVLSGTVGGKQTTHDVSAAWVLNHQYVEFQETSREKNKNGDPHYTAHVYIGWDQPTAKYAILGRKRWKRRCPLLPT